MAAPENQPSGSMSTARDRAHNMGGRIVDAVQETAGRLTGGQQGGGSSPGSPGPGGRPLTEQATEQVTSRIDMGKGYVADSVTGVARALRQTGQQLRDDGSQPALAQFAERSAAQIERFGGYLNQRSTSDLITDLEGFARRKPMAFAGSAFALGMLAVRFLRSEGRPSHRPAAMSSPHGTGMGGSMAGRPGQTSPTPDMTPRPPAAAGVGAPGASTGAPTPGRPPAGAPGFGSSPANRTGTEPLPGGATGRPGSDPSPSSTGAGPMTGGAAPSSDRPGSAPTANPGAGGAPGQRPQQPQPQPQPRPGGDQPPSERPGPGGRNQP